jgi:hypothetical protein
MLYGQWHPAEQRIDVHVCRPWGDLSDDDPSDQAACGGGINAMLWSEEPVVIRIGILMCDWIDDRDVGRVVSIAPETVLVIRA